MRIDFNKKLVCLAPMAGFTDRVFRQICRENGADLVYTEMVSARGVVENEKIAQKYSRVNKSLKLAEFSDKERPIIIQIFGNEPEFMAEAAKIICDKLDPEGIDINMGCPARKVIANEYGSSLLKEPELAAEITQSVKKVIGDRVLSVKTRLGWDNKDEILKFAPIIEAAGADMIAIHGRTKQQGFLGESDWEMIGRVKDVLQIPVLANGGIRNWQDVNRCLDISRADGVLIGQAAIGKPWIFQEIKNNKEIDYDMQKISYYAKRHLDLYRLYFNNFNEIKKHLVAYYKGFDNCSDFRRKIVLCESFEECEEILKAHI